MDSLPRIGLASGGDELRLRSYINHAIYAREHGFDYRVETGIDTDISSRYDYKLAIIRRLLPHYDWLIWIDDDAYFTDFDSDGITGLISRAATDGHSLVIAEGPEEPNGFWSRINTGVMIIRNDAVGRALIAETAAADLTTVHQWWDDARDGLFTGGDQDQLWWTLCTGGFEGRFRIVDHRLLNSRAHLYSSSLRDAAVVHFCGYPDKALGAAQFAAAFGVGQELVPEHLLEKYHVAVRSPMSRWELTWRGRRMAAYAALKHRLRPYKSQIRSLAQHLPAPVRRLVP